MWKTLIPAKIKKWQPATLLLVEIGFAGLIVFLMLVAWRRYIEWYDKVIPVPPIPEGARLIQRQPEIEENQFPFHSSHTRYWYYAKYSTIMPYEEVKAFYERKRDAQPVGYFWVDILPPVEKPVTEVYDKGRQLWLALPLKRYRDDPTSETLIIAEVSIEPSDVGPLGLESLVFCYLPLVIVAGLGIPLYRFSSRLKRAKHRDE